MTAYGKWIAIVSFFTLTCWQGCAHAELRSSPPEGPTYIEGELLIKFKPGLFDRDAFEAGQPPQTLLPPGVKQVLETRQISMKNLVALYPRRKEADPARETYGFDHVYKLAFESPSSGVAIPALIQALTDTGEIEYAEPNYIAHTMK